MKKQSRRMSFIESCVNVVIGLTINVIAQHYIFPLVGIHITIGENIALAVLFTIISICRSYILRRFFELIRVQGITCGSFLPALPEIQKSISSIMKGFSAR